MKKVTRSQRKAESKTVKIPVTLTKEQLDECYTALLRCGSDQDIRLVFKYRNAEYIREHMDRPVRSTVGVESCIRRDNDALYGRDDDVHYW